MHKPVDIMGIVENGLSVHVEIVENVGCSTHFILCQSGIKDAILPFQVWSWDYALDGWHLYASCLKIWTLEVLVSNEIKGYDTVGFGVYPINGWPRF